MEPRVLKRGDVVQIHPDHDELFGGALMVVSEPKSWGAQGYVQVLKPGRPLAYYRCDFANMEHVGQAVWMNGETEETGFRLGEQDGTKYIECLTCNRKSFNPNDIREQYCGHCHKFHALT